MGKGKIKEIDETKPDGEKEEEEDEKRDGESTFHNSLWVRGDKVSMLGEGGSNTLVFLGNRIDTNWCIFSLPSLCVWPNIMSDLVILQV